MDQDVILNLSSAGHHQECIDVCNLFLQNQPENPLPWKYAGKSLLALGELETAHKFLIAAYQRDDKDPEILKDLGNVFYSLCNIEEAAKLYRAALTIDQNYAPAINNLGLIAQRQGNFQLAESLVKQACELDYLNASYPTNLGSIYIDLGNYEQALVATLKSIELNPKNPDSYLNLSSTYRYLGNLDQALSAILKSLEFKPDNPKAYLNLGCVFRDRGCLDQALDATLKSVELNPQNPDAYLNLGCIHRQLGNLDQAVAVTLKSTELNPGNPDAYLNLGCIYKDLGQLDQSLAFTLKSIELDPTNALSVNVLKGLVVDIELKPGNAGNITLAYEILLKRTDISHQNLSGIFLKIFLATIQKAYMFDPIISQENVYLHALASDWRFLKSLCLMIPPNIEAECFLTKLRKELLYLTIQDSTLSPQLLSLLGALATQCYLNEYIYDISKEEYEFVCLLVNKVFSCQETLNKYLPIIGCYTPIHEIGLDPSLIASFPVHDDCMRDLILTQYTEPLKEISLKKRLYNISGTDNDYTSRRVKKMYEENPYPRFRYADFSSKELTKPIACFIELESTKENLNFSAITDSSTPESHILIAGCGTGNQVILSSRYEDAKILAIDLSSSSLSYAMRKSDEYRMTNVQFRQMNLLEVPDLEDQFSVIECGGVLHHMDKPSDGLSALLARLKPGGFIKIGLYSKIARAIIRDARKRIKSLGSAGDSVDIREFRKKVVEGYFPELKTLPRFGRDFYSLSECRDLCFHVHEHHFTIDMVQHLLHSNGLSFCGFMLPKSTQVLYSKYFPEDTDLTSLENWAQFELKHPNTFASMYQFWAQK